VELSVTEPSLTRQPRIESSLARWAEAVADAAEPCLVIDAKATIVALSDSAADLLGLEPDAIGQNLLDGALRLLDFSPTGDALPEGEINKIPPLLALSSARLARGLLRVGYDGTARTLDGVATPLVDGGQVIGSLTFFSDV
jgi:PAS domain-containing protein